MLFMVGVCFVFNQKTAYEMRISDGSSDVCSSDLLRRVARAQLAHHVGAVDLDRARADRQLARDRLVAAALRQPVENLALARGTHRKPAPRPDPSHARGDRKSVVSGTSVSVSLDLGRHHLLQKKQNQITTDN